MFPPSTLTTQGVMMLSRSRIAFQVLLVFGLMLGTTTSAEANTYPGLVEKEWYHGNDILNARIAIEVNAYGEGRFRFHLRCFFTDTNGRRHEQLCNFDPGLAFWCDQTSGSCFSRDLPVTDGSDLTWVGTYRKLADKHTYEVDVVNFQAYFYNSGYLGAYHDICAKTVTWHTGGSPTIGGYPYSWC